MFIALTVQGTMEEDTALQQIISILHHTSNAETNGRLVSHEADSSTDETPTGPASVHTDTATKQEAPETPAKQQELKVETDTNEPEPVPAAVGFEVVRKAATAAINAGQRAGVLAVLKKYGGGTLKDVPEGDLPAVLAEIEAL